MPSARLVLFALLLLSLHPPLSEAHLNTAIATTVNTELINSLTALGDTIHHNRLKAFMNGKADLSGDWEKPAQEIEAYKKQLAGNLNSKQLDLKTYLDLKMFYARLKTLPEADRMLQEKASAGIDNAHQPAIKFPPALDALVLTPDQKTEAALKEKFTEAHKTVSRALNDVATACTNTAQTASDANALLLTSSANAFASYAERLANTSDFSPLLYTDIAAYYALAKNNLSSETVGAELGKLDHALAELHALEKSNTQYLYLAHINRYKKQGRTLGILGPLLLSAVTSGVSYVALGHYLKKKHRVRFKRAQDRKVLVGARKRRANATYQDA